MSRRTPASEYTPGLDPDFLMLQQMVEQAYGQLQPPFLGDLLKEHVSRRTALGLGAGAVAAALLKDNIDGELFPDPDPRIDESWVNPESKLWLPRTYIDVIPGFNNKTYEAIMKNLQEELGQYGQLRRQWMGNKGVDIPGLTHVTLASYAPLSRKDPLLNRRNELDLGAGNRQVLIGHSAGGLLALPEAVELIQQGVEVPLIFLLSTPYDARTTLQDERTLYALEFLNDHGVHQGRMGRWGLEVYVNLRNGEPISEAIRLANDSAYPAPGRPDLSNRNVISHGAYIAQRNGPRISPLLKHTRIVYIASKYDDIVNCALSGGLFEAEQVANGGSFEYFTVDAHHAALNSEPEEYLRLISFFLAAEGFPTIRDLKAAADKDFYGHHPKLAVQENQE